MLNDDQVSAVSNIIEQVGVQHDTGVTFSRLALKRHAEGKMNYSQT
jgi:hypothetical protein